MSSADTVFADPRLRASSTATALHTPLLEIDGERFRANFNRRPFLIGHRLATHPLFSLSRLVELAMRMPKEHVEYNAGNLPISLDPALTPHTGLSIAETIRRIETCQSWMVLKYVERDPNYGALLNECLDEISRFSEPLAPGMCKREGFIFISSPASVTPYHLDPEYNFLLQVRGEKTVHLFDPTDRTVLSESELERLYAGSHRNMTFQNGYEKKAWVFDLHPGQGLHFPVTAPHYVKVGNAVSISFSITFRTPASERRESVYRMNHFLRQRGRTPLPFGQAKLLDSAKYNSFRLFRRVRRLFGATEI